MKRLLTVLLTALILISLCISTLEAETADSETAMLAGINPATEKTAAKTIKLKRGQTLDLWVYPFASTTQFYKDCGKEYPVKAILFSGSSGTVRRCHELTSLPRDRRP